jgi:hypothetical protein
LPGRTEEQPPPGGAGETGEGEGDVKTSPETNGINSQDNPEFCSYALRQSAQFQEVFKRADKFVSQINNPLRLIPSLFFQRKEVREEISQIRTAFTRTKGNLYSSSSVLGKYVDERVAFGCRKENYLKTIEDIVTVNRNNKEIFDERLIAWVHGCTRETKEAIDVWVAKEAPCNSSRVQGKAFRDRQSLIEKCKSLVQGKPCSGGLSTNSSCSSVNEYAVKCLNGKWVRV